MVDVKLEDGGGASDLRVACRTHLTAGQERLVGACQAGTSAETSSAGTRVQDILVPGYLRLVLRTWHHGLQCWSAGRQVACSIKPQTAQFKPSVPYFIAIHAVIFHLRRHQSFLGPKTKLHAFKRVKVVSIASLPYPTLPSAGAFCTGAQVPKRPGTPYLEGESR